MPGSMSTGGFMAIGDTVPTIDPLWGEGIYKCMQSGRAAAATADRCFTEGRDTSAEAMSVYDTLWHDQVAPNVRTRLLMTELLYLSSNERYDTLMRDLRAASRDGMAAANGGNPLALLRFLHTEDLSLLADLAARRLRDAPVVGDFLEKRLN
jgi:digeranylgeranylglycerophospholipid reductase